ncbi:hypothetical protein [Catellatospora vulcania]|uniref:hypothetical protein n=1 Tax=Catellatospora vulcania TaxID=1460450 RepID=UPI0012D47AC8|nr:hypothetical protein [Catellatospora vulcania]
MTIAPRTMQEPVPDLCEYRLHRTDDEAALDGVEVPGLAARFYRRTLPGGRLASVGHYTLAGRDLLMAWGFVDEEHCRFHVVVEAGSGWGSTVRGCPRVDFVRDGDLVTGLRVRAADGGWSPGPVLAAARR